jgi:hypothetical protein
MLRTGNPAKRSLAASPPRPHGAVWALEGQMGGNQRVWLFV